MPTTSNRADLLGAEWTTPYVVALAVGLLLLWIGSHFVTGKLKLRGHMAKLAALVVRAGLAAASLWAV